MVPEITEITDHTAKSDPGGPKTIYKMPLDEVVKVLNTTAHQDERPVFLRVKPDRRVRNEPPPGPDRRRQV